MDFNAVSADYKCDNPRRDGTDASATVEETQVVQAYIKN
jgi:hypothetical protein